MTRSTHPIEQEEVMAYLDGELRADRASAIATHLRQCSDCVSLAASLRSVSSEMMAWAVESSPARLTTGVTAALEENSAKHSINAKAVAQAVPKAAWLRARPWAWALAGALALAGIIYVATPNMLRSRMTAEQIRALYNQQLSPYSPKIATAGRENATSASLPSSARHAGADGEAKKLLNEGVTYLLEGPLIARSASLSLIVKDFGPVEGAVKSVADLHKGYIADLNTTSPQAAARKFTATLRIPSPQLEAALAELKMLGRVEQETQSGEDVTKQYTDVAARLKNSRITEQRLLDILRERTGKMKDILEIEEEIERVRGEIEQMEAEQRGLQKRIDFATVQLSVSEEYKASLQVTPPTGARFHNAAVEGFRSVIDGTIEIALWLLEAGPSLLLWAAILFFPARWAWKRWRRAQSAQATS